MKDIDITVIKNEPKRGGGHPMKVRLRARGYSWCGPSALSAITGMSYESVTRSMRDVLGRRAIKRVSPRDLTDTLSHLNYKTQLMMYWGSKEQRPTLAHWFKNRPAYVREPKATFLVVMSDHVAVIRGRKYWDNSKPDGCYLKDAPYRRKHLKKIFKIW